MSKPLRVLIVEDSEEDTELLIYQLERSGYQPTGLRVDTPAAMTAALAQQWDVVIADYTMPHFSATAALTLLQEQQLDLPFIIVSGSIGDGVAVAAMKAGAHDYLLKGNLARLVPAIERSLQEAANRQSRRRAEQALKQSEERWHLALRGNNDGLWDWNIKTSEVFYSVRWKEMLGYEEHELANRYEEWRSRVHPDELGWVLQAIQDHFAKKNQFYNIEHRIRCKDGTYKWILSRGQALWDEDGNPMRMVGSHTDITQHKQMEVALRQQAETLAEANRLKDEFLAVISHELRTPLNSILGWSQMLRSRQFDAAKIARALETIERNAKLQKQLVEDLLDASRVVQGKLRLKVALTSLVPIIEAAIKTVRAAADAKGIQLETLLDDSVGFVSGDADRLHQVLWHLLMNAIKFTPPGGWVQIQLQRVADAVELTVRDTGIGVSAEFLPYVFDHFRQENSTTTRAYGGLGLGLSIVHHLVELHGGTIRVESAGEGKGTAFVVQLPLVSGPSLVDCGQRQQTTDNEQPLDGLNILVVDDDADTQEFLLTALTEYGAAVTTAASVREALKAFERFMPDVLVSDIGMPGENGYDLIRQVRLELKRGEDLPALALTAYATESDRDSALEAGFQIHLPKPIEAAKLVAAIAHLAGRTTPASVNI